MELPHIRYFRYFDWFGFAITISLCLIGLLFIFSSTYTEQQPYSIFFKKQCFGFVSGLIIYALFSIIDYRRLCHWGFVVYIIIIGLLFFTLIKGKIFMGGQRWISLFFFRFQPSEVAKLFLPAFITYHLHSCNDVPVYSFRNFAPLLLTVTVSFILILKQPDLGTALLVACSGLILLWFAGLQKKFFIALFCASLFSAPLLWHILKPYQKNRIAVFFGAGDASKERYQLEQSKIAIGSGGFFGKGLLQGTQNRLMFLPEGRTDFIFAILCEEWGFLGALLVLVLYLALFIRLLYLIFTINNFFAQLLAFGLLIHIMLSTLINIGMVTGLLPIVGIPLPLLSYGISNLWITLASLGWINGISIRQHYIGQ
ncbi:MAG: rod shape-determining protein RodA [Candidatus Babeliales bacterium]